MSLLTVKQLTKTFGTKKSVNEISFTLESNTATALIGPNGAGKTTAMSMITGLLTPTSGDVILEGSTDIRRQIGFLPQYPKFYSWLSALEYVEMVAQLSGISRREARKQSEKVLQYVGLGQDMKRLTSTFSGGMKQRLGIAQAIVHEPKLLLLDEPVSALDPIGRAEIMSLLKELQQTTTILYSTHILHDAEQMTDQVLFMKAGRLVEQGTLAEIQQRYADPKYVIQFVSEQAAVKFAGELGQDAAIKGSIAMVNVTAKLPTMASMLSYLVDNKCEVVKVEQASATLDEIFMKVAGASEVMASAIEKGI